ncbi:hypothetical protein V2J09_016718 [Rumex salicifolius]
MISGGPKLTKPSWRMLRRIVNSASPATSSAVMVNDIGNDRILGYDPLTVHVQIVSKVVKRVLVDTSSLADILFWNTYQQLDLSPAALRPTSNALVGFSEEKIKVLGTVEQTVVLVYHSAIKFVTANGPRVVPDQIQESKACNAEAHVELRLPIFTLNEPPWEGHQSTAKPDEEADLEVRSHVMVPASEAEKEAIIPYDNTDEKLYVGKVLDLAYQREIAELLAKSRDMFAWTPRDLKGIPVSFMTHSLNIAGGSKPVRQKKRKQSGERAVGV